MNFSSNPWRSVSIALSTRPATLNSLMISGSLKRSATIADRNDVDHEQDDVGDVELPDPLGQAGGADDEAAFQHHPGIDEGGGIA